MGLWTDTRQSVPMSHFPNGIFQGRFGGFIPNGKVKSPLFFKKKKNENPKTFGHYSS